MLLLMMKKHFLLNARIFFKNFSWDILKFIGRIAMLLWSLLQLRSF